MAGQVGAANCKFEIFSRRANGTGSTPDDLQEDRRTAQRPLPGRVAPWQRDRLSISRSLHCLRKPPRTRHRQDHARIRGNSAWFAIWHEAVPLRPRRPVTSGIPGRRTTAAAPWKESGAAQTKTLRSHPRGGGLMISIPSRHLDSCGSTVSPRFGRRRARKIRTFFQISLFD